MRTADNPRRARRLFYLALAEPLWAAGASFRGGPRPRRTTEITWDGPDGKGAVLLLGAIHGAWLVRVDFGDRHVQIRADDTPALLAMAPDIASFLLGRLSARELYLRHNPRPDGVEDVPDVARRIVPAAPR
jgi:hypothetical protein